MGKLDAMVLLSVLCVVAPGVATPASSCTVDADCDNGDTCSVPDTCVSGGCVLGGGGDADGDYICDDEANPDADVDVNKVVAIIAAGSGRVRSVGSFIDLGSAGQAFTGSQGVGIRVKDTLSVYPPPGDGIDLSFTFAPGTCVPTVRRPGEACKDPATKSIAKFVRDPRAPSQISFSFRIRGISLTRPFFGPVQVILTHNGQIHRRDVLTDCKLYGSGIKCREF
jgi:hypothetical protein